ncbi:MAG: cyclic nucleotide-binding domain-containing protein, partial [Actinomycetota bacterium]
MSVDPALLGGLDLVADIEVSRLAPVARRLTERDLPADCTLIRQGQPATSFALVLDGELDVTRRTDGGDEHLAVIGPGSIVGELALLRRRARVATVSTEGPARVLVGDREALVALLHLPQVVERLRSLVSRRLAEDARPVVVESG